MKDDVKVIVPNETPRILIPLNGVVNWNGVLKFGVRPEGDRAMHFLGFTVMMTIKRRKLKCIKCMNKMNELYDVPACYTKFLKYDPS